MKNFSISSYRSASLRALGINALGQEIQIMLWGRETARLHKKLLSFGRYRFAGARGIEVVILGCRVQIFKPSNVEEPKTPILKTRSGFRKFSFSRRHIQFTRFDGRVYVYPWGDCFKLTMYTLTRVIAIKRFLRLPGSPETRPSKEPLTLYQVAFNAFLARCNDAEEELLATGDDSQLKELSNQVFSLVNNFIQHDSYLQHVIKNPGWLAYAERLEKARLQSAK